MIVKIIQFETYKTNYFEKLIYLINVFMCNTFIDTITTQFEP